ncbi:MAG: energy transducer TonB [Betaproteobacteria bacterium]|nr:MAG: energy transducer TonB [Betaproteobacteria bacterium]
MRVAVPAFSTPTGTWRAGGRGRLVSRRLGIALAISLAAHAFILSLQFRLPEGKPVRDRGLEVVLVNARHAKAPDRAEVLAQANLAGGGTSEQTVRPKSPLPPQNARRDGDALVEQKRRQTQPAQPQQQVLTRDKATAAVSSRPQQVEQPAPTPAVSGLDLLDSAAAVARLESQIDRNLDELARRPRTQFIGARAREYRFAQYVEDWRQKVERIGTLNYPDAARGRMYGSLLLSVTIRADGSVERVGVHRSSGHKVLDEAAVRIVRMAAPYAPFPPDIRRDTDLIEITRTWTFTNADEVRAN